MSDYAYKIKGMITKSKDPQKMFPLLYIPEQSLKGSYLCQLINVLSP